MFRASRGNILIHWDVTAEYFNPIKCTKARKNNTLIPEELHEPQPPIMPNKIIKIKRERNKGTQTSSIKTYPGHDH